MLDGGGHHVLSPAAVRMHSAENRQVIAFRPATREYDFARRRTQGRGECASRLFQFLAGPLP